MSAVIFVDDETHVRLSAKQTLELANFEVLDFASAQPALSRLSRDWDGILITDVQMPHMDGLTLLKRAHEIDPDLPVVLITGHGDIAMAVDAMRNGAYDFIEKPCAGEILVDVVKRAMEKRTLVLENRALPYLTSVSLSTHAENSVPSVLGATSPSPLHKWSEEHRTMSTISSASPVSSVPGSSPLGTSFTLWMTRSWCARQITRQLKLEVRQKVVLWGVGGGWREVLSLLGRV